MINRRDALVAGAGLGAALFAGRIPLAAQLAGRTRLDPSLAAQQDRPLITKPIPSSGEEIPVLGLGSWQTFDHEPSSPAASDPLEVMRLFHRLGGTVIDTAPSYGRSEAFVGWAAGQVGATNDLFLATKVNVQGEGMDAAVEQMTESSRVLGSSVVDLMQIWNLGDNFRSLSDRFLDAHVEAVMEWKARGRARYVGFTTSFPRQYEAMERALGRYELDFVQLDYSIGDLGADERLIPLAWDRGYAILVNRPFATGGLFSRTAGQPLPEVATDVGCESWAQFFLKFVVSHPTVTAVIPATGDPEHLVDNMGAGRGRLADASERGAMLRAFEAL